VKELLRNAPGVTLFDDENDYPTPVRDATGKDEVLVGGFARIFLTQRYKYVDRGR
jgi:aspartate-semialdehyde dehydrogenase